jgi:hypothetical protein
MIPKVNGRFIQAVITAAIQIDHHQLHIQRFTDHSRSIIVFLLALKFFLTPEYKKNAFICQLNFDHKM